MDAVTDYTATATRVDGWWMVQCDQHPGALSQVRRLDQAVDVHREAIAFVAGVAVEDVNVVVEPVLSPDLRDELGTAERLSTQARQSEAEARRRRRDVARRLADEGLALRDIGTVLGVSYQRVHQLLDEPPSRTA